MYYGIHVQIFPFLQLENLNLNAVLISISKAKYVSILSFVKFKIQNFLAEYVNEAVMEKSSTELFFGWHFCEEKNLI